MMFRAFMLILPAAALAACSDRSDPVAEAQPDRAATDNLSIKDQVLQILCDDNDRNVQEALVEIAEYARKRDGRSDRVWEVADEADCEEVRSNRPT